MRYKVPTIFKIGSFGKEHYFMVEIVVDYLGKLVIIFLGELDGLLYALVIFVVLDYITGICAAIQAKHLSSNIGAKGICKKGCYFFSNLGCPCCGPIPS